MGDILRRAVLTLDSDLPPDPVLLTNAARHATELGDVALAARVARAAVAAGGGFEPRLILGNALSWSGGETDNELSALSTLARTDIQRAKAAIPRVTTLAWALGRPAEAEKALDATVSSISDETAVLELTGMRSVLDAYLGRTVQAAEAAAGVLAHPRCSPAAKQLAGWGLATACGGLGRLDEVDEALRQIEARVESFDIGLHQAAVAVARWLRALLLAGLLDRAEHTVWRYRERCQDIPGPGDVITSAMCGAVAQARGQARSAVRWYRQAVAGVHDEDPGGWLFTGLLGLTSALGMAGETTTARQILIEMTAAQHPLFRYREPDVLLAHAWVAAAEGILSQAIAHAHHAAEVAASQHPPAVEVLALHTAVCFGDRTQATRLAQLATQVDGPRAPAAALAVLTTPLPLTTREREIATLAVSGLTNHQIAQRLVISIRTVENHLHRAYTKLGTTNRTELATLLHHP